MTQTPRTAVHHNDDLILLKPKFFNDAPVGYSGIAVNMRRPPLDDIRIRKALCHLYDRKTFIEKLFFNEYERLDSYYPGRNYGNPDNVMMEYDEFAAVDFLEEAGWKGRNAAGYRVKDGKELAFTLTYRSALSERSLTVFQESCKRAGIRIELQLLTPAAGWKNMREKEFELVSAAWGALVFPNPETSFHGKLAGQKDNNNVTSFSDSRVDELCTAYDREYDVQKRIELVREIDGIVFNQHPYVLGWYLPCQRVVLWNKFGMPEWGGLRVHEWRGLPLCWWVDPEKEKRLAEARANSSMQLDRGDEENHFWAAWNAAREKAKLTAKAGGKN